MILYQTSDIEKIIEAIDKKAPKKKLSHTQQKQFAERLDEIALDFLQRFGQQKRDPASSVLKKLSAIEKHAMALGQLLQTRESASALTRLHAQATHYRDHMRVTKTSVNSRGELEKRIEPPSFPDLSDVRKAVESLCLYAGQAIARETAKKKSKGDKVRNKGNVARQKWVNGLACLWVDIFDELPGVSVDPYTHRSGGPFVRFVVACYKPLEKEFPGLPVLTEDSVRAHYRKTAEAKLKRRF